MKVLVCGDREWVDRKSVYDRLRGLPVGALVIHGGCRGADEIAGACAKQLGFLVQVFPALWSSYGRAAGPIRNRQMLDEKPDLVLAFHSDLKRSKGTRDTVREAERRGIPVEVIRL